MAKIGSNGNGGGNGGDWPRVVEDVRPNDEAETPRSRINDQTVEGALVSISAEVRSIDGGNGGHVKEVGGGKDRRTMVEEGGLSGASGSGSSGGGSDVRPETLPRDPARGKGVVTTREPSEDMPMGPVKFRPTA
ncbi:hypothetical protein RHMOL_Rhmol02G0196900 [Rhododendron molle]|uniref:Uncharacterized protein n=1 Tax=Rhododendron molle TaxID=49168 RepID=A0ACC0PUF1_RHOML|nr:hypothetical protein RHMOL_Rhmol02G0196900 [Rhododendron molle]